MGVPAGNRRGRWSLCGARATPLRGAQRGASRPAFDAAKVAAVCGVEYHSEATLRRPRRRARRTPRPRGPGSRRGSPRRGPSAASSRPSSPRGSSRIRRCRRRRKLSAPAVVVPVAGGGVHRGTNQEGHLRHRRRRLPAAFVPAGAWAETAEVTADLNAVGASRAVAHLVLRDGDQFFAGENLPWARLEVNGRVVRVPHDVKHGDVVRLAVRAESAAEIEAWTAEDERAKTAGALGGDSSVDSSGQNPVVSSRGDPVRSATLKLGSYEGVLRARVADRGARVAMYRQALRGATTLEAAADEEETKVPKEETKVPKEETKVPKEETKVPKEETKAKEATKPPAESTRARIEDEDDQETAAAKVDAAIPVDAADPEPPPPPEDPFRDSPQTRSDVLHRDRRPRGRVAGHRRRRRRRAAGGDRLPRGRRAHPRSAAQPVGAHPAAGPGPHRGQRRGRGFHRGGHRQTPARDRATRAGNAVRHARGRAVGVSQRRPRTAEGQRQRRVRQGEQRGPQREGRDGQGLDPTRDNGGPAAGRQGDQGGGCGRGQDSVEDSLAGVRGPAPGDTRATSARSAAATESPPSSATSGSAPPRSPPRRRGGGTRRQRRVRGIDSSSARPGQRRGGDGVRGGPSRGTFGWSLSIRDSIRRRPPDDDDDDDDVDRTRDAAPNPPPRAHAREPDHRPTRARGRDGAP